MNIWKNALVYAVIVCALSFAGDAGAQSEKEVYDGCMSNFDLETLNFRSPDVMPYTPLLHDYFVCRAIVYDNVNECANLIEPNDCRRAVTNYWLFYGRLVTRPGATQASADACSAEAATPQDREGCRSFADAIAKSDPSLCGGAKADSKQKTARLCAAISAGDPAGCPDQSCKDLAIYVAALRSGNPKMCDRISTNNPGVRRSGLLQLICKSALSGDINLCLKTPGISDFKKAYCENLGKKQSILQNNVLSKTGKEQI